MSSQIVLSLAVEDIARAKLFCRVVLGCSIERETENLVPLSALDRPSSMALYSGAAPVYVARVAGRGDGFRGIALSCIVDRDQCVDEVLTQVGGAGGKVLEGAQKAALGGYVGYIADPDGNLWKVVSAARPSA